jgi:hypothetical protein
MTALGRQEDWEKPHGRSTGAPRAGDREEGVSPDPMVRRFVRGRMLARTVTAEGAVAEAKVGG